jgi:tRNA (guanine10-N2)-dimethyltransferase
MTQSILILGRQPALGIAEAESLFGSEIINKIADQAILIDKSPNEIDLSGLGGSTRLARLLTYISSTEWQQIEKYISTELPKHTCCLPEGKIKLGVSVYGININTRRLNASGLTFKKAIKAGGRSVRVVPNSELSLNTAQVIHNQLASPTGMELLLIRSGDKVALAQTVAVQDIKAYADRDQARPARDARVGMLPPKLAQIIINLSQPNSADIILDPFCGTGVVLQEALLLGYEAYGTDIDERMINYSERNLKWLTDKQKIDTAYSLEIGDATEFHWKLPFDRIAGETYLGRPFSHEPKPDILNQVIRDVDTIHYKFLENVARQTKPGFKMCIAVPAWFTKSGTKHLKTLDKLTQLGYNRLGFVHASNRDLIYHRENQIVGRELVTLIRI